MRVDPCSPLLITKHWNLVKPLMEKACASAQGEYSLNQMMEFIIDGSWLLWIGSDPEKDKFPLAIAATCIENWASGKKICRLCFVSADEFEDAQTALEPIKEYAAQMGCTSIVTEGRKGWSRRMGWKPTRYVYEVAL